MDSTEKDGDFLGALTIMPKFEIIEIDENIIDEETITSKRTGSEVNFDFNVIEENSFKCVCTTCNNSKSSVDGMLRHINENKDSCGKTIPHFHIYFKDYENLFTAKKKFGEVFIKENHQIEFLCIICNIILQNKNIIFTHLTQHLNEYKKDKMEKNYVSNASQTLPSRKKFVDIYIAENPNHYFLYACTSCDYKIWNFLSIYSHLEQKRRTCGNFDVNIRLETDRDNSFDKNLIKVCEVYMNSERKAYFVCLCCNKQYSEHKLVSEHLLVHWKNKKPFKPWISRFSQKCASNKNIVKKTKKSYKCKYKCSICYKILFDKYLLRDHLMSRHSIKDPIRNIVNKDNSDIIELSSNSSFSDGDGNGDNDDSVSSQSEIHNINEEIDGARDVEKYENLFAEIDDYNNLFVKVKEDSQQKLEVDIIGTDKLNVIGSEPNLKYQCKICLRSYLQKRFALNHLVKAHNVKIKYFEPAIVPNDKSAPTTTTKTHHDTATVKINFCNICGRTFVNKNNLKTHMNLHDGNKQFACPEEDCNKRFVIRPELIDHIRICHTKPPFQCPECGKSFLKITLFDQHRKIHNTVRKYECILCYKSFFNSSELHNHILIHTGEKSHNVKIKHVEPDIVRDDKSKPTVKTHNTVTVKINTCDKCGKTFANKNGVRTHMKLHNGNKNFGCPEENCEEKFVVRPELIDHIRVCHTKPPFQCPECGKSFLKSCVFDQHRKIHKTNRKYECILCYKFFFNSSALHNHILIHTGEKPHACEFCSNSFRLKEDLRVHVDNVHNIELSQRKK